MFYGVRFDVGLDTPIGVRLVIFARRLAGIAWWEMLVDSTADQWLDRRYPVNVLMLAANRHVSNRRSDVFTLASLPAVTASRYRSAPCLPSRHAKFS